MPATRPCPYCAEEILEDAILCRYCRSRVTASDPRRWFRDHPSRKVAGVTSGVARALALPLPVVRAAFVLGLLFNLVSLFVYVGLWVIMPFAPDSVPPYRKAMAWVARQLLRLFGGNGSGGTDRPQPPAPGANKQATSLDVFQ